MINKQIIRRAALITVPAAMLTLTACATPFRADVSRFQQLPPAQGQSFTIKAADVKNDGGIEFGQYASLVSARMSELGYVPASASDADLTVTLDYGVSDGRERVVSYGGFNSFHSGFGFGRRGFGRFRSRRFVRGFHDPFLFGGYGFGGFGDVRSFTIYNSDIELKIKRNSDGQSLFEGRAEAQSRSNKLPYLVPNLVEAMFTDFPGNNGEAVRISVAPEKK